MIKRTLCLILSAITVLSGSTYAAAVDSDETTALYSEVTQTTAASDSQDEPSDTEETEPADDTMVILASLVKKYPTGKYWNHMGSSKNSPETVTGTPCSSHRGCSWAEGACSCNSFDRAIQCMGYAHKIAYDITGESPRSKFTKSTRLNVDNLRVGDIIRFRNDGHSICITGVSGSKISFTDCNWDYKCGIRWGVMDISYIKSRGFTYVLHLSGNDRKNTDLYFFDHIEEYETEEKAPEKAEIWKMSDSNLNVRAEATVDGKRVGSIPANSEFYVTDKLFSDKYLWGYVYCGSVKGWAALNYSEYESGAWQKADIKDAKKTYKSHDLEFEWNEVSGADYYLFRLYDADKKLINQFNVYGETTTKVRIEENGKYYAKLYSRSKHVPSWKVSGTLISFTVNAPEIKAITSVKLDTAAVDMLSGDEKLLTASIEPADYTESLVWESSSEDVVSVADGTLTAKKCGIATVYCKNQDGTVSAECKVTVKPANITGITLVKEETTTDCITFVWDALDCADSYDIHRYNSSTKKYVKVGNTTEAKFTDSGVQTGKNYYYLVRGCAKTADGTFKGANTKVKLSTRPPKVTGFKQDYSASGTVRFVWDKADNATVYYLYRYDSVNKKYIKIKSVKDTTVTIKVEPGEKAYYKVHAATKVNPGYIYSAASNKALSVAGPEKPTLKVTSKSKGTALLTWSECSEVYRYYVYRYEGSECKRIAILKDGVTEYKDTGLKSGKKYTYKVRAIAKKSGITGYGSYSSKITAKIK